MIPFVRLRMTPFEMTGFGGFNRSNVHATAKPRKPPGILAKIKPSRMDMMKKG